MILKRVFIFFFIFSVAHLFAQKNVFAGQWVSDIIQDSDGFIWIGSQDGLHKYDGKNFKSFRYNPNDKNSLPANWVKSISQDKNGVFWLGTQGAGLVKFEEKTSKFTKVNISSANKNTNPTILVFDIFITKNLTHWVITDNGLYRKSLEDSKYLKISGTKASTRVYELLDGTEIIVHDKTLYYFNKKTHKLDKLIHANINSDQLLVTDKKSIVYVSNGKLFTYNFIEVPKEIKIPNDDIIKTISNLRNGKCIIVGTNKNYTFNIESQVFQPYNYNIQQIEKLGITNLFLDDQNLLWVSTNKGLYKESLLGEIFSDTIDLHARKIIKYSDTTYIAGDTGLHRIIKNTNGSLLQKTLNNTRVTAICKTKHGLWFSHYYGRLFFIDNKDNITTFDLKKEDEESLKVFDIIEDKKNRIWVSTWKGIYMLDAKGEIKNIYSLKPENSDKEVRIIKTQIDKNDNLWVITLGNGLYKISNISDVDASSSVFEYNYYVHNANIKNSINSNVVTEIHVNQKGDIWIGSDFGINIYNKEEDNFYPLIVNGTFFDKKVMAIETDDNGLTWISTIADGIYIYNPSNKKLFNLREEDGLISNACLYTSSTSDGNTLYFGTDEGVQVIDASRFSYPQVNTTPKFTSLHIKGEYATEIQDFSEKNQPININHNQPNFSVSFAITDYRFPEKINYYYRLGDYANWTKLENNTINFNSLNYGDYNLSVKAAYQADDNVPIANLALKINPPWHKSMVAYTLLFLILAALLYYFFQLRYKQKLASSKLKTIEELDLVKSNLFTNISHELRTPLTLISGPIEHQLSKNDLKEQDREELNLVKQNADRLLNLVNQLMDLALIDSGQLKLKINQGNLNLLISQATEVFQYQAEKKNIKINAEISDLKSVWFDKDSIEKIVFNLLSNAVKYATPNSSIELKTSQQNDVLVLSVVNKSNKTNKDLVQLFERFYQNDASAEGVGVGLALVKELVTLNNGSILANKLNDDKIQFTVTLPIHKSAFNISEIEEDFIKRNQNNLSVDKNLNDETVILIVEDDDDIRAFIKFVFKTQYKIIEAINGEEGINIALKHIPDLIISDIMMPIKDGVELCNNIKNNELTSHIPIILLTAKVGEEHEIIGLKTGADAYITKPFSLEKLKTRVEKLLEGRTLLQKHYSKDFNINPELKITSTETKFLKRLQDTLQTDLTNPDFTSERFSEIMLMSRTQLHRKLKAIVNMSASEFIRKERLKLAIQLLKESDATVSEIAYQVGFNSSSYFIKCFKDVYNCTPNEYLSKS